MEQEKRVTFKLFVRPQSHMQSVLTSTDATIEKAIGGFRRWYKKMGVNCDDMSTFVVVPVDENGNGDWSKANGWDTTGVAENKKTVFYPKK